MKVCIIKLGAKGDVIRTLPILTAIKEKYPDAEITWLTKASSKEILETISEINELITLPCAIDKSFDILYNFDIDDDATKLAMQISANKKFGFYSEDGFASAFNFPAEYYLNTLFDDELKKSNTKTYQQMMFDLAELAYKKQPIEIQIPEKEKTYAEEFLEQNNLQSKKILGIHIGASPRWPSKVWHKENLIELIRRLKEKNYEILLFGGPDEIQSHENLTDELEKEKIKIHRNNPYNTDREFLSLLNLCDAVVSGDTFALHCALALQKPTIGLFFCTSPNEIEDYGICKKIVSPMLNEFFPEKSDQYSEELVRSISADEVLEVLESFENKNI